MLAPLDVKKKKKNWNSQQLEEVFFSPKHFHLKIQHEREAHISWGFC